MKQHLHLLTVTALSHLVSSAINPTSSGQIGIDVVDDFGPATQYVNTKWIGVDQGYLTQDTFIQTYTQTIDSKPTPATSAVQIAVATATMATDGYEVGDVSVVLGEALVTKLKDLASTACGGGAKLRIRQTCSLEGAGSFVEAAAGPGGVMNDVLINGLPRIVVPAADVAKALQAMVAAGKIATTAVPVATLAALWLSVYLEQGAKQTLRIPKGDVGTGSGTEPQPQPSPSPTSSSAACPTGANAPLCADQANCKGAANVCTDGKYKTCQCIDQFDIDVHEIDDADYLKQQQAFLASVAALPLPAKTAAPSSAPQPSFSATPPVCNTGDKFPGGDVGKMRAGFDGFCKGINNDAIQKVFNPTAACSVQLADGVWMELVVSASYLDLQGACTTENMDKLSTSPDKCNYGMTKAVLCASGQTVYGGGPSAKGGYDTVECVLYQVNTVTSTKAPACPAGSPTNPSPTTAPIAPSPSPAPITPKLTCNGLGSNKYINAQDLDGNIDDFCTQAAAQGVQDSNSGSIARSFNPGTTEDIAISMDWPPGLPGFKPVKDDCKAQLSLISINCDGNDPANPMNWKGGGSIGALFGGVEIKYNIHPTAIRPKLFTVALAHVETSGLKFWLNGSGWSNKDGGDCLKSNFNGCLGSGYDFQYGIGDDDREWTMTGWGGPGQGNCLHNAVITCGGPDISWT